MCVSHEEKRTCIRENTTDEKSFVSRNLNASTKYYVSVLASTRVGRGNYSESVEKFTNGSKCYFFIHLTKSMSVPIFIYFYSFFIFVFRATRDGYQSNSYHTNFHVADSYANFLVSSDSIYAH